MHYLLFDIGGTHTRVAIADKSETFCKPIIFDTPEDIEEFFQKFRQTVSKLKEKNNIQQLHKSAGGVPGTLQDNNVLIRSPNLKSWVGTRLKDKLQDILKIEVMLENDADMNALGEAEFGLGVEYSIIAYLTISTGVGGSRVVDGQIDKHSRGFEPGHQIISVDGLSECKDLESLVSGSGIKEKYNQKPKNITDESIWQEVTQYLAIGIHNTVLHWSPEVLILGGGVMEHAIDIKQLKQEVKQIMTIFPEVPEFIEADLGNKNGLYGALAYLTNN